MSADQRVDAGAGRHGRSTETRRGRKRDPTLDVALLDATLAVLAERGYDGLTVDLVAARAGSARATVYRRWPTKVDLVLDAVAWLSRGDTARGELPDTGSLRGDIAEMIVPLDDDGQQLRFQAMAALLAVPRDDARLAAVAHAAGLDPWIAVNRELIGRAVERGEFPRPDDLDVLAELIPTMCIARAAQRLPITEGFFIRLIDGVLLPALRGGP